MTVVHSIKLGVCYWRWWQNCVET